MRRKVCEFFFSFFFFSLFTQPSLCCSLLRASAARLSVLCARTEPVHSSRITAPLVEAHSSPWTAPIRTPLVRRPFAHSTRQPPSHRTALAAMSDLTLSSLSIHDESGQVNKEVAIEAGSSSGSPTAAATTADKEGSETAAAHVVASSPSPVAESVESPASVASSTSAASPSPVAAAASPSPSPAAAAAVVASSSPAAASPELLNGGYKRGGAENDPITGYYDEIEIEDMDYDEDADEYTYPCPCGDKFRITKDELLDGEDIARCPSCSLLIKVVYDPDDLEDD